MASAFTHDNQIAAQQLAIIRRQESAAWVEQQLTDAQRRELAEQKAVLRNDAARGLPSCFGSLE